MLLYFFFILSPWNMFSLSCTWNIYYTIFSVKWKFIVELKHSKKKVDNRVRSHIKNITDLFSNTSFLLPGLDQSINCVRYCLTSMTIWMIRFIIAGSDLWYRRCRRYQDSTTHTLSYRSISLRYSKEKLRFSSWTETGFMIW